MKSVLCLLGVAAILVLSQPGCVIKECETHDYLACYDGDVYWFDSCDEIEDPAEVCDCGCDETGVDCNECCYTQDFYACDAGSIYWYDSCGYQEDWIEDCDCGCNADESDCAVCVLPVLDFEWTFEGQGCAAAGISTVYIELYLNGTYLTESELDCTYNGATIEDLEDGSYELYLYGKDAAGDNHYYTMAAFTISGMDEDLGVVDLDGVGYFVFDWDFDGWDCVEADVEFVDVLIYDGATLIYEADPLLNCTDYGHAAGDFYLGTYNLVVEGLCYNAGELGYELDVNMAIENTGENDYGLQSLTPVAGGCP